MVDTKPSICRANRKGIAQAKNERGNVIGVSHMVVVENNPVVAAGIVEADIGRMATGDRSFLRDEACGEAP